MEFVSILFTKDSLIKLRIYITHDRPSYFKTFNHKSRNSLNINIETEIVLTGSQEWNYRMQTLIVSRPMAIGESRDRDWIVSIETRTE